MLGSGKMSIEIEIGNIMTSIVTSHRNEVINTPQDQLDKFWYFKYDPSLSKEWNMYQFSQQLEIFKKDCRTWEEHHNGHCCVVERVRDQYLMPKIKQFMKDLGT